MGAQEKKFMNVNKYFKKKKKKKPVASGKTFGWSFSEPSISR